MQKETEVSPRKPRSPISNNYFLGPLSSRFGGINYGWSRTRMGKGEGTVLDHMLLPRLDHVMLPRKSLHVRCQV